MSAVVDNRSPRDAGKRLPLLQADHATQVFAWHGNEPVSCADFLAHVRQVAALLPDLRHAANLCEDRYHFIVAFCAVVLRGQINLLPPSRAPQAVAQVMQAHADGYVIGDCAVACTAAQRHFLLPELRAGNNESAPHIPQLRNDQIVAIGYTSGSTGAPKPNPKTWGSLSASTALNAALLQEVCRGNDGTRASIVATVPAQHMYGLEMSVLLPLLGEMAVHSARPLFPVDIVHALLEVPSPRLLVTTPVHLRALLRSGEALPGLAAIVSATAPMPAELASEAEQRYGAPVIEVFGSTESCVIAHRRAARDEPWQLYADVELKQQPDGTLVNAPYFTAPVLLADIVELLPHRRFVLSGRNSDLLEIAGKRASLGDLTRCLLGLRGVLDGVVFQLEPDPQTGLARIAALVIAPGRSERELLDELRHTADPVFLPRPLRCVENLPRNEAGKLPREALLAALENSTRRI